MIDLELALNVLSEAVTQAAKVVQESFSKPRNFSIKTGFGDIVTEHDKNTEVLIIGAIKKVFPDHKFIGEETADKEKLTDDPTWIIDPIDGTTNFVHGFPYIGISVGLSIGKEILLGLVCCPPLNQTFTAIKGKGAYLNGQPIHTSNVQELKSAVISQEISLAAIPQYQDVLIKRFKNCVTHVQGIRSIGCAQMTLCQIAVGNFDAYQVEFLGPWDVAAGSIIVTEAGGTVIDLDGGTFDFMKGRCIAACSEKVARSLVELCKCD